jgi:hypothetical protein
MASWQTLVFSTTTETHTLHPHFHSKCGGCKYFSSFDFSTVDDAIFGGNDKGDINSGDEDNDGNDNMDNGSKDTFSLSSSSGDSSSSASNPVQPSSNRNTFGCRDDADVMCCHALTTLCTNNSLQQRISSSDSSSLIAPHQNPDCNAHVKAHSYKVGDESSDVGTDCTSSNKSAMVDAGDSSFPIPNLFKPSSRLSFKVSNVLLSKGWAIIGPVGILHLGSPERGNVSQRGNTAKSIGTQSSTMAVKARRLLQPAKGANEDDGNGSGCFVRHKKAQR